MAEAREQLGDANAAREAGLAACRQAIRAAGSAIRAVHRLEPERAAALLAECESAIRRAQEAVRPFPAVANAGFLHDAEKEYAEAVLTRALVSPPPASSRSGGSGAAGPGPEVPAPVTLPSWSDLDVGVPAWLNGLAEAASELRRHLLDRLRADDTSTAEVLLSRMEDVYEELVGVDFPDAVTGGLRRSADALRAVLERTRSDVTTTLMQLRLRAAIEGRTAGGSEAGANPVAGRGPAS